MNDAMTIALIKSYAKKYANNTQGGTTLKPLRFTGAVDVIYDGSKPVEVGIPHGGGATDEQIASAGSLKPLKTINMGEVFEQPENYLAWFQGCLKYDEEIDCPVGVFSGKDAHSTGSGKCYFFKIDPKTGEVTLTVAGQYDDDDTYGCFSQSFYIDNDGNYAFYAGINKASGWAEIEQRKYVSIDKGKTWTYTDVSGSTKPAGSVIKLKNGRLIGLTTNDATGNARACAIYSDNNGETWTVGYGFPNSTEVEIIELADRLIAIGRKNLTYDAPLPAVLYFSEDNGESWTDGIESTTLTDMCNPCSGVYWEKDELLELFYCSRASVNGNTGTIYHAYAKLKDVLNDNFTVEAIGNSKQDEAGIDFGYCATACDQKEKGWVIYYDRADSGSGVNLNLILADKTCVTLPVSDKTSSLLSLYSSAQVNKLLTRQYNQLIAKINEAILSGEIIKPEVDEDNKTSYIFDGIVANFNLTDSSTMDTEAMTVTDTVNGLITTLKTSDGTFPEIRNNSVAYSTLTVPAVSEYFTNPNNFMEGTFEFVVYREADDHWDTWNGWYGANSIIRLIYGHTQASYVCYYDSEGTSQKQSLWWPSGGIIPNSSGLYVISAVYSTDGTLTIYKNGEVYKSYTATSFSKWDSRTISGTSTFSGTLKTARIYNRALTAEEVAINYKYERATIV